MILAAQGGENGAHADCLKEYDQILKALKASLGSTFKDTLILTLTEFGRTVKQNGGKGTEHGYGTAVLMAGGLIKKSEVHGDWPGLKKKDLFEGRDLNSTMDATYLGNNFDHLMKYQSLITNKENEQRSNSIYVNHEKHSNRL